MSCECHTCQTIDRIQLVLKKLPIELVGEVNKLISDLWDELESADTDLGVLRSKISGVWPREDGENYYERIGDELYEVHGIKVNENATQKENRG